MAHVLLLMISEHTGLFSTKNNMVHTVPFAQICKNKKVPSNRISIIPRTKQLSLNGCEIARLLSNTKAKPIGRDP